jgi:hypothetical protein
MVLDVLPLRAVLFQFFFLMMAIAIDAVVFYRHVEELEYKPSVQYAATANLSSTCLGWLIFFGIQPLLPLGLKEQLISFIFFGQFFPNEWINWMPQTLVGLALFMFTGTIIVKLIGLNLLEQMLEKPVKPEEAEATSRRKRLKRRQAWMHRINPRREFFMAVLRGCSYSFSAMLLVMLVVYVDKFG